MALGWVNPVAALGIALAKMVLIMLFFMHLRRGPAFIWIFAVVGFVWLGLLLGLSLADYATRGWLE